MSRKRSPIPSPHWVLSDHWGISVEKYNWILKYRGFNPEGTGPGKYWVSVGYWARLDYLFLALMDRISREDPQRRTIEEQTQRAYELSTTALSHFTAQLEAEGLRELKPRQIASERARLKEKQ